MRRIFKHEPAPRRIAGDVDEELEFHIQERTEKLIASGMSAAAARTEALRQFGDLRDVRNSCVTLDHDRARDMRRGRWFEELRQDLAYAFRSVRRNPGFALVVVLTLALGIGANTSIFTLIDAVLLRRLPVPAPERLVAIGDPTRVNAMYNSTNQRPDIFAYEAYKNLRDNTKSLSGLLASGRGGRLDVFTGAVGDEAEHPRARYVSGNYFGVLGVPAFLGRTLEDTDDRDGAAPPIVVISHGYWSRKFAADPGVLGRVIRIQKQQVTIVGVTPPWFRGEVVGNYPDLWLPLTLQPVLSPNRPLLGDMSIQWLLLLGRRRDGVSEPRAHAEVTNLVRNWTAAHNKEQESNGGISQASRDSIPVGSGARGFSWIRATYRAPLIILMSGVALVLLMICANIANLLFARALGRGREMGVRLSLGAGRGRLVRQLLTESLLLAVLGTAAGLLLAVWSARLLLVMTAGSNAPGALDPRLSLPVLGFTTAVSLVTLLLFGLAPALRTSRVDLGSVMRAQSRSLTASLGRGAGRLVSGQVLIATQVALSLVLLLGAALLVRSLQRLENTDTGLDRDHLLIVDVAAQDRGLRGEQSDAFVRQVTGRLERLPGVEAVSFSENGIFSGTESSNTFEIPGYTARAERDTAAYYDEVGPGYVRAIGGRLLEGRDITERDVAGAPAVALVNQTMARFYWPRESAIGKTIRIDKVSIEVIGVLADTKDHQLDAEAVRRFYLAYVQRAIEEAGSLRFVVRTGGDPALLSVPVRAELKGFDAELRVDDVSPLSLLMRESIAENRLLARLAAGFGALALLLAAVGLYGLMTFATTRRTGEIGLRMALGARRGDVVRMVLLEALRLVATGLVVGIPLAYATTRLLRNQLFDVPAGDPVSIMVAVVVLCGSAAVAALVPALRAARVDPLVALRTE